MLNFFREPPLGVDSSMSIAPYPNAAKPRFRKERRKGFLNRLLSWNLVALSDRPSDISSDAPSDATDESLSNSQLSAEPIALKAGDEADSSRLKDLIQQGYACAQQKDWNSAAAYYRRAIQLDSQNAELHQYLAEVLSQQGDLEESANYYRQAIELAQQTDRTAPQLSTSASQDQSQSAARPKVSAEPMPWFEQASFHLQQAMVSCNAAEWQDAIAACQMALSQLEPEASTAYLILGRSLHGQQQLVEAEQIYQKALTLKPDLAEVHARLASLYADQNRLSDAVQSYQAAIQLNPNFAGAYWKLAQVWHQLGEHLSAATCLYEAFRLQPDWASAIDNCRLADRLFQLNQLDLARECYDRAIGQDPTLAAAYLGIGSLLFKQNESVTAIYYYQQGIQQCPDCMDLYVQLAHALVTLKDWQLAADAYRPVLNQESERIEAIEGLRTCCYQLKQWDEALVYSQKLVELQPQVAQHWHQLAEVYSRLQYWSAAIPAYQQAIQREPTFSWSHNNLADALIQMEQWQDAVNPLRTAIVLNPSFPWSHYNLGEALVRLQDWDGAIEAYRTALNLQPDLPYAAAHLADALQRRAVIDRNNALTFYTQEIQRNPADPENYYKALELQPDSLDLYLGLTDALMGQERWDEALACCQIARQMRPEAVEIIAKLKHLLQLQVKARRPQMQDEAAYDRWMAKHTPTAEDLRQMATSIADWSYQPVISIMMPVYNPPIAFLEAAVQSVLDQVYPHWQLCIADDASADLEVLDLLNQLTQQDDRIRVVFRSENGHISAASNSALALATGEFVALFDHDDRLAPEALYEVVSLLNQHPEADMIYSDEDKLNLQGKRVLPFFKPNWCPDSFLSRMYTCHLGVYRRQLVEAIGGFRVGYEGSQDYDLVLRLTEQTDRIFHIPKVLYHWRDHAASTSNNQFVKPYAEEAAKRALLEACDRRGEPVREIVTHATARGVYIIHYEVTHYRRVSIIIPTRNLGTTLDKCLQSIFDQTTYPNYEVVLIDNGSDEIETLHVIDRWERQEPERLKCYSLNIPFNYSTINNLAVTEASGDYLLFLNNDVEVITPDWIEAMVEQAQRSSIGVVGTLLLYPDDTVQHAGVILGIGGVAGHSHKYFSRDDYGYFSQLVSINNYSAVTAACMMCRRSIFEEVGGFDEELAVAFNDVDFCLKVRQLGYKNLMLPHVQLYHHESKSRGVEDSWDKQQRFGQEREFMKQKWGDLLQQDPCYSPHLSLEREDYSIRA